MTAHQTVPDPAPVLDLIEAFRCSKVMFAAVSLGVFDRLASGPASVAELAGELNANPEALERLLDTCTGLGLLDRSDRAYANTATAAAYLCRSSPKQLTGYIRFSDEFLWRLWEHLEDAVREGSNRWRQVFGGDGSLFSHFFRSEDAKREFLLGMDGFGQTSSPEIVTAFDLGRFRCLGDLGGATGHLAIEACRRYPKLRGVVFDLPGVVPLAREKVQAAGLEDRIEVVEGDFFTDALPEADLFALGRILHDWAEDKIRTLLHKIHNRLPANGAVLIAEKLLDEDKKGPKWAHLQSLNMLVCTEGKERTASEYTALLKEAGFARVETRQTASPLDAVLAFKA